MSGFALRRSMTGGYSCTAADDAGTLALTSCGGVLKTVLQTAADEEASKPKWGALVRVRYTGRFPNGTIFDQTHADKPFEFQLNTDTAINGMERGVRSMRVGERARLQCEPEFAYGTKGVGSRIPPNATLVYDVELVEWHEGPPIENDNLDMDMYRKALEGKSTSRGAASLYSWSEGGEEVIIWIPLKAHEGARDIQCEFRPRMLMVSVGSEKEGSRQVSGSLKGKAVPDESYWVIEEEHSKHGRALQIVIVKADAYARWDGALIADDDIPDDW